VVISYTISLGVAFARHDLDSRPGLLRHKIYADLTQYGIVTGGTLELIDLGELDGAVREGTGLHRSP
jgi:hypothetical protein